MTTSLYQQALRKDTSGDIAEAVKGYIASIEAQENILDAYINVAVIFLSVALDYGVESHYISSGVFTQKDVAAFSNRYADILAEAQRLFPSSNEPIFWKKYAEVYYHDINRQELMSIIHLQPDNPVPYFLLYVHDATHDITDIAYWQKIEELREICAKSRTTKNMYIASYIDSVNSIKNMGSG